MSAFMLTATIAVPARGAPDFDKGRALLDEISDVSMFDFDDPETDLEELVDDFDPDVHLDTEGKPTIEAAKTAGHTVIDRLEKALELQETTTITVAGYKVYISGGLSSGNAPTDAAQTIWDAYTLPSSVLSVMGFTLDYEKPPSSANGANG